ncbi:transmembrane protein, putative [Bodo saltans]|uniref:Transmembrane protein, putative n=1 Tax=Bodo saltans TaxID=75058 RepID=A0A0S4JFC0_BODSA|nr:transmembrane protein, putative [Bodo saltans]|eukprot:CUG88820.1 transmembrane protein, putative [Bodo saltans]
MSKTLPPNPHKPGGSLASPAGSPLLDEFGFESYVPRYPNGDPRGPQVDILVTGDRLESVVPWELRTLDINQSCPSFHFVSTVRFWRCVEGAIRTSVVGLMPAAILLYTTYGDGPWKSQSLLIVGAMLAILRNETIGLQVQYFGNFLRASVVFVVISVAATAVNLFNHIAAAFIVYAVSLFLMGTFMVGYSRRVAMLYLTVMYMDMLRTNPSQDRRYFDLWVEILIGTCFAFFGAILPWPALSSNKADEALDVIARNISIALHGLTASFWTDTNLTRNVQMVRVRFVLHNIENSIGEVKKHLVGAEHEWMLQSSERRGLRLLKIDLYVQLLRNLSSIRRVVDIVRDRPGILSHSERATLFGERLGKRMEAICIAVDELLYHLNRSTSHEQLLKTGLFFDKVTTLHSELQVDFHIARREFFYETQTDSLEEFVPLMTFYVFCVSQICITLTRIKDTTLRQERARAKKGVTRVKQLLLYAWEYFSAPLVESYAHMKNMVFRRNPTDVRYVLEAVKVSMSMVASIIFYYYTDSQFAFLSGPTIIAFLASQNPAEAVISSIPRLCGTLMGVVVGFFIANNSTTAVARIAGLITFVFFCRIAADVKYIGPALMYAAFISISQLSVVPLTQAATMSRIQQSTFAVFIYMLVTLFVFPCRPTTLLREVQSDSILRISKVYQSIMAIFIETGDVYATLLQRMPSQPATSGIQMPSPYLLAADLKDGSHVRRSISATSGSQQQPQRQSRSGSVNEPISLESSYNGASFASAYLEYPKEQFEDIDKQLKGIDKCLLELQNLIPFAAEEPRMSVTPFPTRSSQDALTALKKVVSILRTMTESIRLLRERRTPPSKEMISLLRTVAPCAKDTIFELHRFSLLIATLVMERRLDLGTELSKSSRSFSHMCSTFHRRKSVIFLQLIRVAVANAVSSTTPTPAVASPNDRAGSKLLRRERLAAQRQSKEHSNFSQLKRNVVPYGGIDAGEAAEWPISPQSVLTHRLGSHASLPTAEENADDEDLLRLESKDYAQLNATLADESDDEELQEECVTPAVMVDRNMTPHHMRVRSLLGTKVTLPDSFTLPVTVQDSESVHTLTFSIVLLAGELRNLLVAMEDSLQHRGI